MLYQYKTLKCSYAYMTTGCFAYSILQTLVSIRGVGKSGVNRNLDKRKGWLFKQNEVGVKIKYSLKLITLRNLLRIPAGADLEIKLTVTKLKKNIKTGEFEAVLSCYVLCLCTLFKQTNKTKCKPQALDWRKCPVQ